ncbi:hypothetical protein RIF29_38285 [Crotalaria pallida]|uniref:Mediator of RNA polymerase II transcription subunit 25 n=1 Tax=Crotalaria pallida TaxID=3830 RepID=A0AAN9E599_CROPI
MGKSMEPSRWLTIVVDGIAKLAPYWTNIFSDYLQKIVRGFCDNSEEQGARSATCKLGFVIYNANFEIGFDVQSIDWTTDVDMFLGKISCLAFHGDASNQYAMVEGLADALRMYTRPFDGTIAAEDFYNGERHCILVTAGDPVPWKMTVSVPVVREGKLVLGNKPHETFNADFLEVAKIFRSELGSLTSIESTLIEATPNSRIDVSSSNSSFKVNASEDIVAEVDVNTAFVQQRKKPIPSFTLDPMTGLILPPQLSFGDDVQDYFREKQINFGGGSISNRSLTSTESQVIEVTPNPRKDISSSNCILKENVSEDKIVGVDVDTTIVQPRKKPRTYFTLDPVSGLILPPQLFFDDDVQDSFEGKQMNFGGGSISNISHTSIESHLIKVTPNPKEDVSLSNSFSKVNTSEDIMTRVDVDTGIVQPRKKPRTYFTLDPVTGKILPPQLSFNDGVQNSFGKQMNFGGGSISNSHFGVGSMEVSSNSHFGSGGNSQFGGGSMDVSNDSHLGSYSITRFLGGASSNTHFVGGTDNNTPWVSPLPTTLQATQPGPLACFPFSKDFCDYVKLAWEGHIAGNIQLGKMYFGRAKGFMRQTSNSS